MRRVDAEHTFEVAATNDEQPVEALGADSADEALGVCVRLWCADWCLDHRDAFAVEDLVEGGAELAVAVMDQEAHPFEDACEAEVARLLGDPGARRVGRAASKVDAAAFEFDEEEHVEASERDRLDGEEIAGEHAGGLLAEELPPARAQAPRRGSKTIGKQDAPDRAWRRTQAQLQQLASDPRVAPARVLPREAHDKLADVIIDRRTAGASTRLRPLTTHELAMPAQKGLWRDDQAASALLRQDSRQHGEEGAIGRPQRRAPLLPPEYDELMSQNKQLDVFGELAAAAADQQTQHSREGEIGERKDHAPMLPSPATRRSKSKNVAPRPSATELRSPGEIWYPRARVNP